jgi:hypothetical protein
MTIPFVQQVRGVPLEYKKSLLSPNLSFRGERTPGTWPDHGTRCATEESTVRHFVACRDAPTLALSCCFAAAAMACAAASGLARADIRFLGPAIRGVIVRLQRGRASE